MFRELLTRIPDIYATSGPVRLKSPLINGIKRLPVASPPATTVTRSPSRAVLDPVLGELSKSLLGTFWRPVLRPHA